MSRGEFRKDQILEYIYEYNQKQQYPPSIREICEGIGLRSTSTVYSYLKELEAEGRVILKKGTSRTMRLMEPHKEAENKFVIKMNDCGMVDASILPTDSLTVIRQDDGKVGDIVVALYDDNMIVRRIGFKNNSLYLIPESDSYICIRKSDATIIGKVISMQRDL